MSDNMTTWQVLRAEFPAAEYVLIQEVSDASGHNRSRSLDFMLINLWNSRGLAVTGIELKSNRGDWLKELKNPAKQEKHFKHCDYFYLLTDKDDVARIEEIPANWGWYHKKGNRLKTMKAAPKLISEPIGRSLMCAMLRRAADKESYVHVDSIEDQIEIRVQREISRKRIEGVQAIENYKLLKETVVEFEKASGIKMSYRWDSDPKKVGEAVSLVLRDGLKGYQDGLIRLKTSAENILNGILKDIETIQLLKK